MDRGRGGGKQSASQEGRGRGRQGQGRAGEGMTQHVAVHHEARPGPGATGRAPGGRQRPALGPAPTGLCPPASGQA